MDVYETAKTNVAEKWSLKKCASWNVSNDVSARIKRSWKAVHQYAAMRVVVKLSTWSALFKPSDTSRRCLLLYQKSSCHKFIFKHATFLGSISKYLWKSKSSWTWISRETIKKFRLLPGRTRAAWNAIVHFMLERLFTLESRRRLCVK